MTLWTLKSVLNVVVKKLVSDWIRLVLFGKKIVNKYTHYLINYAKQSNLSHLVGTLILNQENQTAAFIHNSCRTELETYLDENDHLIKMKNQM